MINRPFKIYLIILVALIAILTYLEANEPQKLNWFPSYVNTDKIPLGTFVFYDLLKKNITTEDLREVKQPPYEFLTTDSTTNGTYIFINGEVTFDDHELDEILHWVSKGNALFISASTISEKLLDTLNLETEHIIALDQITTQPLVELVNEKLKDSTPYHYDRQTNAIGFSKIDTCQTVVLGNMELFKGSKDTLDTIARPFNEKLKIKNPDINFVRQDFGDGTILLHTFPEAFSNYFILDNDNYKYPQNIMSYVDLQKTILWDNYYKAGKKFYTSPLYLLLTNRYLKWAYYIVLLGVVLFVVFEGKRKQRSIPILKPLKNQTLAFTRTISGMYFREGKHTEIAKKQIALFLEYIRSDLRIPTDHINDKNIPVIAARSGNTLEDTATLFDFIKKTQQQIIDANQLQKLYRMISDFKDKSSSIDIAPVIEK